MRLELTRVGLLVELANHYTTRGAFELTILAHGLDHCIPSRSIKREEVYSEFEVLFTQHKRLQPVSTDRVSDLKVRLNDLAYAYVHIA